MAKKKTATTKADNPEVEGPTEEEMKKHRQDAMAYYKQELPLLRLQAEYEECITRVEVAKIQRVEIMVAKANMMAPPPGEDEENPQANPQQQAPKPERPAEHQRPINSDKRTLKTAK